MPAPSGLDAFIASLDDGLSDEERRRRIEDFIEGRGLEPVGRFELGQPESEFPDLGTFLSPQEAIGSGLSTGIKQLPARFKGTLGGLARFFAEPSPIRTKVREFMGVDPPTPNEDLLGAAEILREESKEELAKFPEPRNELERIFRMVGSSAAEQLPTIGLALAGMPGVGLGLLGTRVFGEKFGEAREAGLETGAAELTGLATSAAEVLGEKIALGPLTKPGLGALKRVAAASIVEPVQEGATEAMQIAIDAAAGLESPTLERAVSRIKDAALVGGILGPFFGGGSALVDAAKNQVGGRKAKKAALRERIEEVFDEGSAERDFAIDVVDGKSQAPPEGQAEFIRVILDTNTVRSGGTNANVLAQQIEVYGLERAASLNALTERETERIKNTLDGKKPSSFGVKRIVPARDRAEMKRQETVRLISTNDPAAEFQALFNNQKVVTIFSEPLTNKERQAATELGLKVVKINSPLLDKGKDAVRVVYNPRIARALFLGLQQDRHAARRSLVGNFKDEEVWIKTMARKNPRGLGVLSAGALSTDFAGNVTVNLTRGGEIIRSSTVNGADMLSEAALLLDQAEKESAGVPAITPRVDGLPIKRPRRMTTEEKGKLGGAQGEFAITIEGKPIEELAALNNVPEKNLRQIQRELSDLGLDHEEATALTGTLTGSSDALQRGTLIEEAAKVIQAVRPDEHPNIKSARDALDQALKKIDRDLPEEAKFYRFPGSPESESGPVAPRQPPPEGPPSPPPEAQSQVARILGVEIVEDADVAPATDEEVEESRALTDGKPGYRPIPGSYRKTKDRLTGETIYQNSFTNDVHLEIRLYRDHIEVSPSAKVQGKGYGTVAYREFVLKQGEHLGLPVWSAVPERFKDMRPKAQVLTAKNERAEGVWKSLVKDGLAYWNPQMLRYVQILPGVEVPPHGITDLERAGQRVEIDGTPLDLFSPVEAARMAQGQSAHPPIEPESSVDLTARNMQQQTVEQALEQRQEVRQLEDQLVEQAREQVGDVLSEEDVRELIFTEMEDPVAGAKAIIRRAGLNLASESAEHEEAINQTIEQVLGIRDRALGIYRSHPAVLIREAAVRLVDAESAAFGASAALMSLQTQRMRFSDDIVREWRESVARAARKDYKGAALHADKVDAIRAQFDEITKKALELDQTVSESHQAMAEAAGEATSTEGAALVRRGARHELAQRYSKGEEDYVATVMRREGISELAARDQFSDIQKKGWEQALPDNSFENNLPMVDAAYGGQGPSARALLRTDSELNPLVTWIYSTGLFLSPQTAGNRNLAEAGRAIAAAFEVNFQKKLSWFEQGQDLGARLNRILPNETDRYYTGRYIENDFSRIDEAWLEEIQTLETPRAKAVQAFRDQVDEARKNLAFRVDLPVFRQLRDWFGHFADSASIVEMLKQRKKELQQQIRGKQVKGKPKVKGLPALSGAGRAANEQLAGQLKDVEKHIVTFTREKMDRLAMLAWHDTRVPKKARYGPLLERTGNMADYVTDPTDMLMMAWRQAGQYGFLKEMLPMYDDAINRMGGTYGPENQVIVGTKNPIVVKRLSKAKKLLWSPPDEITETLETLVGNAFIEAEGNLKKGKIVAKGAAAGAAAGALVGPVGIVVGAATGAAVTHAVVTDPQVVARAARFIKRGGFYMHLGLRASSAIFNLMTLGTHTALRVGAKDTTIGLATYIMDQVVTGDFARAIPGLAGSRLLPEYSRRIGGRVSPMKALWDDVVTDLQTHYWELADAPDVSDLRAMLEGTTTGIGAAFSIMFHGTEAINRGASFYAEAGRAIKVLEYYQKHGSLDGLPDSDYMDGYIAPTKKDLADDWALLRRRIPKLRQLNEGFLAARQAGVADVDTSEAMAELGVPPQRMEEFEALMKSKDRKAPREWFDIEAGIRAVANLESPMSGIKDIGIAAMNDTQGTYGRMNRPPLIARGAPVLELTTALTDFTRFEAEFFAQRLSIPKKLAFAGILYAMGGPKALPGFTAIFQKLFEGEDDEEMRSTIQRMKDAVPIVGGLAAWMLGSDIGLRLKSGWWVAERLDENTYSRLSTIEKAVGFFGGTSIQPLVEANAAMREASERTLFNAKRLGTDFLAQARIEVQLPEQGLRQDVPIGETKFLGVGVGKLFAHPWANIVSPWDITAAVSQIALLPDSVQARLAVTSEAFRIRPSGVPGYLEVPSDAILQTSGAMRDMFNSAQRAEGARRVRGKPVVPLPRTLGGMIANIGGLAPGLEAEARDMIRQMSIESEFIDKGTQAFITYAIKIHRPVTPAHPGGRPATPKELVEYGVKHGQYYSRRTVINRMIQTHNPLLGRFSAQLSKETAEYMFNERDLSGKLEDAIRESDKIGNLQMATGLMMQWVALRRRHWSRTEAQHRMAGTGWTQEEIGLLSFDINKKADSKLSDILDKVQSGTENTDGTWEADLNLSSLLHVAASGDPDMLMRLAREQGKGDARKELDIFYIGLFLMDHQSRRLGAVQ